MDSAHYQTTIRELVGYAMVASSESVHGERKLGEKILTRCMGKDMRIHFRLIGLEVDLRICRKI